MESTQLKDIDPKQVRRSVQLRIRSEIQDHLARDASFKRVGALFLLISGTSAIGGVTSAGMLPRIALWLTATATAVSSLSSFAMARNEVKQIESKQKMLEIADSLDTSELEKFGRSLDGTDNDLDRTFAWSKKLALQADHRNCCRKL